MSMTNSESAYGAVSKVLHWTVALLILTLLPLGLVAVEWPYDTSEALSTKAWLFSLHKTLGVAVFFVALARIFWAFTQPRPAALHPERRLETALAEGVHWLLYVSIVAVPASGWIQHAATTGFAPIWWPLGQTLPFVPQSPEVAAAAGSAHALFTKLLMASLALHVAGALKHHVVDKDATLRRMLPGRVHASAPVATGRRGHAPAYGAIALYALAGTLAVALTPADGVRADGPRLAAAQPSTPSGWTVESGAITFTVAQMGSPVTGSFGEWTADIAFDETPDAQGRHGSVTVTIYAETLAIGSVTQQAKSADFFAVEAHPTARFTGEIRAAEEGDGYIASGTLDLAGASVPVELPFALAIDGDTATAEGRVVVDRRSFGMGETYTDESTVGFSVTIGVSLTATRAAARAAGDGA